MFVNKVKYYIDTSTTTITKLRKSQVRKTKWITSGLIKSINTKTKLYKTMKNHPSELIIRRYKEYRNAVNLLIKKTKMDYFQQKIQENKNNSKQIWTCVKEICLEKGQSRIINEIKTGDKTICDVKEISDIFVNYFTFVGKNLANQIKTGNPKKYRINPKSAPKSMFLQNTDTLEVIKTIQELKDNKAPGYDEIRAETLKLISREIAESLTYIINGSFNGGTCPTVFKKTIIKPLYKSGDKYNVVNYRPISLITNFAKIFEKILKTRITSFINKNNILSERQCGFREKMSTQDAITYLTTKI